MHDFEYPSELKKIIKDEGIVFCSQGKEAKEYEKYRKSAKLFGTIWIGGLLLMFIQPLLNGNFFVIIFFLFLFIIGVVWVVTVKEKLNKLNTKIVFYIGTTERIIKYRDEAITSYEWSEFANMTNISLNENKVKRNDLILHLKTKPGGGDFRYKRKVTNGNSYVMKPFVLEGIEEVYEVERKCFEKLNKLNESEEKDLSDYLGLLEILHSESPKNNIDFLNKESVLFITRQGRRKENQKGVIILGIVILILPTLFTLIILSDISNFLTSSISVILLTIGLLWIFFWIGIKLLHSTRKEDEDEKSYFIGLSDRLVHITDNNLKTTGWNEFVSTPKVEIAANGDQDLIYDLKGGYKKGSSFLQKKIKIIACSDIEYVKKESTILINRHIKK
jgi:hypothetical protein